jgi:hypothetical protein
VRVDVRVLRLLAERDHRAIIDARIHIAEPPSSPLVRRRAVRHVPWPTTSCTSRAGGCVCGDGCGALVFIGEYHTLNDLCMTFDSMDGCGSCQGVTYVCCVRVCSKEPKIRARMAKTTEELIKQAMVCVCV